MAFKGKKKNRKLNFVDIILLIIILAIASALIYVFVSPYTKQIMSASTTKIEYKILVEGVRDELKYNISQGDKVTETTDLRVIGKVVSVEYSDTEYVGADSEGNSVIGKYPGKKDITVTISADASSAGGTYEVGGFGIAAGKTINFRVPGFTGEGSCIYVGEVAGNE